MKPPKFEYLRPASLDEALQMLAAHAPDAKPIAGGQSLVPMMNLRMAAPGFVVDIGRLDELKGITIDSDDIHIGACVAQRTLLDHEDIRAHAPLLVKAASHVGHVQTRARGTLGGSLSHADPAAELCLAALALDARLRIRSVRGERECRVTDFFDGALMTTLEADELLCEIVIRKSAPASKSSFRELARRHGDFAVCSVAVQCDHGADDGVRAAIGGIRGTPYLLSSFAPDTPLKDALRTALDVELEHLEMNSDLHASADYRRALSKVLLSECIEEIAE